jgi:O-antigen/teichoic acid export membrane protein
MIANAATYLFYAMATRALGVDSGGALLAIIAASLMLSVPVGVVGLGLSGVVSHLRAVGDFGGVSRLLRRTTWSWGGSALALLAAALLGSNPVNEFFHVNVPLVAASAALIVVATAGLLLARGFLQGVGEFRRLALSNLTEAVAKVAAAVFVAFAGVGFVGALVSFGGALLAAFLVSAMLLYVHAGHERVPDEGAGVLRQATPVFTAMGALTVMTFFDAIAARHFLSAREAGLYNAAALAGRALMTVLAFVPSVLLPKVRERVATDGDTNAVVAPAIAFTAAVCLVALAVFTFAPRFVAVFVGGRAYAGAAYLIPLYGIAASALAVTSVLATIHAAHDRVRVGGSLLVVMALEVTGVVVMHDSAMTILRVIVAGHVAALLAVVVFGAIDARKSRGGKERLPVR